jgi:ribosomal protein L11 methylase PrmA
VLTELAGDLAARAAPTGAVILSGLLSPQAHGVGEILSRALGGWRARVHVSTEDPEWSAVTLTPEPGQ